MKQAHYVELRVFVKPDEPYKEIKHAMHRLIGVGPDMFEEERIEYEEETAIGFNEKKIKILRAKITKNRRINDFLDKLKHKLGEKQNRVLRKQDNRIDEDMCFYVRLEKEAFLDGLYELTDGGDCFHVRINLATYPKKKEKAKKLINQIFSDNVS